MADADSRGGLHVPDGCAGGGPDPATSAWFRDDPLSAGPVAPLSHDPVLVDRIAALVKARGYDRIACFSRDRFHVLAVEILDLVAAAGGTPAAVGVVTAGEIADGGDGDAVTWLRGFRSNALNRAADVLGDLTAAALIVTTSIVIVLLCLAAIRWAWGLAT